MTRVLIAGLSISMLGMQCANHSDDGFQTTPAMVVGDKLTAVFYNIENLFDTINDPDTNDDDFTPEGKLNWTNERYANHLSHSAQVLSAIDSDQPELIGLCEIENRLVLEELITTGDLSKTSYSIVHHDSPDERGIDVALLYDKKVFSLLNHQFTAVFLPDAEDRNTREILYASLKCGNDTLHVFVNHWPSRSKGQEASEPNRIAVAEILKTAVDSVSDSNLNPKILIMGDFNDYPDNISISKILDAGAESGSALYNLMAEKQRAGEGSYCYKDSWGCLDQFIASHSLINSPHGLSISKNSAAIFREEFILFTDAKGNKRPNRIFVGDDYKGGYSDHLPVYLNMVWN